MGMMEQVLRRVQLVEKISWGKLTVNFAVDIIFIIDMNVIHATSFPVLHNTPTMKMFRAICAVQKKLKKLLEMGMVMPATMTHQLPQCPYYLVLEPSSSCFKAIP